MRPMMRWALALALTAGAGLACQTYDNQTTPDSGVVPDGGTDPPTLCDEAAEAIMVAIDRRCRNKAGCCFCDCWADERQVAVHLDPCECEPAPDPGKPPRCEGALLEAAEACLADKPACVGEMIGMVEVICKVEED